MAFDIPQRIHSFTGKIGKPSESKQVAELYARVSQKLSSQGLLYKDSHQRLAHMIASEVLVRFELERDHAQFATIFALLFRFIEYEALYKLPDYEPHRKYTTAQYWELLEKLERQNELITNFDQNIKLLVIFICSLLDQLYAACPALLAATRADEGIVVPTEFLPIIGNAGALIQSLAEICSTDEMKDTRLLEHIRNSIEANLVLASGGDPSKALIYPNRSKIASPEELVLTYFGGTPLVSIFEQKVNFTIPMERRFEHQHIVAGSGHGKTQALQYMILNDLEKVAQGGQSVVVIDSQSDMINQICSLAAFAPNGVLHDKLVVIDPSDIEYPVALNLFDVGQDRLTAYSALERERLTNSILELYDFVLGSLLEAGMTQKQSVIFRYVTRLMLYIPDATIHTLRELMEDGGSKKYADYIAKLPPTARAFFSTEFDSREFTQTKRQVLRRLWGILENQTFERMFSYPKSKLNLFAEMNAGKVILINTAKDLLKESGTEIFGRFFIALIAQAAQERATLTEHERMSTTVYIDEAADYFDQNISIILSQARKYKIGMILAHQYLGQLSPALQEAFAANTAIKMAGGVSTKDARALAGAMHTDPENIERQPKGSFATYIRGLTPSAVPLQFPLGALERAPKMSSAEVGALRDQMRQKYAMHYSEANFPEQQNATTETPLETERESITPDFDPVNSSVKPTKGW